MFQSEKSGHRKIIFKKLCRLCFSFQTEYSPRVGLWGDSGSGLGARPWAALAQGQERCIQRCSLGSGIQPRAGPIVSKVLVDWSANESIRKLLAAGILSQTRAVHSLRKPSEGHTRVNLSWLWPS